MMPKNENPDNNNKPKKSAKKSIKKTAKKSVKKAVSSKYKSSGKSDLAKIMKLIEQDEELINYRKTVKHITSRIHEHLSCFILIGYSQDGTPVQITTASNPRDYDALSTALQKYLFDLYPKGPPGS